MLDVIDRVTDRRCQYPTIFLDFYSVEIISSSKYHCIFIMSGAYISEIVVLSIPIF